MANIRLKELMEASVDPKLVARSKESGKMVYFKTPQAKANAMKAGTHEDPKAKKADAPKGDAKPNSMFGKDYNKDRGAKAASKSNTNWMDDLDSIDTSDVKGKADPSADSWTHGDVFGATFKDPQTGKPISVGDAYDREDDSPAYQKAFAYVAQFNPDDEAVMGTQAYDDLQKNAAPKADVKSIVKDLLKKADKEFKGTSKLKDIADDITIDTTDDDGKELQARIDKGEDGIYVQTDETEGTVVFPDGTQYQFHHVEDGPIPVTKVGKEKPSSKLSTMMPKDSNDGPKINGKDQTTPNRQFDKKKPFDPKEIEKDVKDMLQSDGYEVEHQWGTTDYFLNISKKDKKGKEIENYTVQKDPKTGLASVWDAKAYQWVVKGEPNINRLYDTIGQIPYFRED
jgi:hypothetical protein